LLQDETTSIYYLKTSTYKKGEEMKQSYAYSVDLTKIEGKGEFSCPRCGTLISPDDTTEETYSIVEPKVNSHGLEELVITCNLCNSQIHITGFSLLEKLSIE
jgi:predicted RNA-binding Zn-ribbon protein involved in translation (DUF1610 family)